jgi:hypothetical protein
MYKYEIVKSKHHKKNWFFIRRRPTKRNTWIWGYLSDSFERWHWVYREWDSEYHYNSFRRAVQRLKEIVPNAKYRFIDQTKL